MPIVQYKPNQVRLQPVSTNRRQGPDPNAFGAEVGQSLQGMGRAVAGVNELVQQQADQQAETRAREADVTFSSHIREETVGENGINKLQGQAYVDNAPSYLKRIEDKGKEIEATARTPFERRMIADIVARRMEGARAQIQGQSIREGEFANKASALARLTNQTTNLSVVYRDPQAFARERAALMASVADAQTALGATDPASMQAAQRKALNDVHAYAVQDMMQKGEVGKAQAWLDEARIKNEIDPGSAVQLQERIEKATTENEIGFLAEGEAPPTEVSGKLNRATPELVAAVGQQESHGNGLAVSPKGAQGVMQVMPATGPKAAMLAGVAWQPERMVSKAPADMKYQKQLGEAYLNDQLKTFGGSVVVALAAYNAGPGAAAKWVKKFGDPAKGEITPTAWANKIPFPETKAYVSAITARLGGTTRTPLSRAARTVEDVETFAAQFSDDPKKRNLARAAASAVVNRNRTAENQRQSDAWDAVQPYIQKDTPWSSIPKNLWNAIDPQHQTAIMEAQKKGLDRHTSPEALDTIYNLMEQSPEKFKQMDMLRLAPDFSPSDFEQLRRMQNEARTGRGEWKKTSAQYAQVTRNAASIAPPTLLLPRNKSAFADFKSRWWTAVQAKQAGQKEPMTDDEVNEIGTRMTAEVAVQGGNILFGRKSRPLYEFGADDKHKAIGYSDIPAAEQSKVFRFLSARGHGKVPTAGEVLDTWRTLKATGDL